MFVVRKMFYMFPVILMAFSGSVISNGFSQYPTGLLNGDDPVKKTMFAINNIVKIILIWKTAAWAQLSCMIKTFMYVFLNILVAKANPVEPGNLLDQELIVVVL